LANGQVPANFLLAADPVPDSGPAPAGLLLDNGRRAAGPGPRSDPPVGEAE
jgi:hypothetical protein